MVEFLGGCKPIPKHEFVLTEMKKKTVVVVVVEEGKKINIRREIILIMKLQLRKQNIVRMHSGESVVQYLHIRDAEAS